MSIYNYYFSTGTLDAVPDTSMRYSVFDPTSWGTPDKLKDSEGIPPTLWESQALYTVGDQVRIKRGATVMKAAVKPGPYKSSTHGNIRLSVRGRELLNELRNQTAGKIEEAARAGTQPWKPGDKLSHARGELAMYMSDLEQRANLSWGERNLPGGGTRPTTATEALAKAYGMGPSRMQTLQDDLNRTTYKRMAELRASLCENFLKRPSPLFIDAVNLTTLGFQSLDRYRKETTVTEPKKEPTRAEVLSKLSDEVVSATRELAALKASSEGVSSVSVYGQDEQGGITGPGGDLNSAVAKLVKEQWATLRAEAIHRAELRVWNAEKELAWKLGSEIDRPKPRKGRAKKRSQ